MAAHRSSRRRPRVAPLAVCHQSLLPAGSACCLPSRRRPQTASAGTQGLPPELPHEGALLCSGAASDPRSWLESTAMPATPRSSLETKVCPEWLKTRDRPTAAIASCVPLTGAAPLLGASSLVLPCPDGRRAAVLFAPYSTVHALAVCVSGSTRSSS
jgi:hypothetical protein